LLYPFLVHAVKGPFVGDVKILAQDDLEGRNIRLLFDRRSTGVRRINGEKGGMLVNVVLKKG
jgi:hypothetical protein